MKGELQNGFKQGFGKYFYLNINEFEGHWVKDKKQGHGVIKYKLAGEFRLLLSI